MWKLYRALAWSDIHYNDRDRISHPQRTKQRAQEEEVSWTCEEILDGQGSWTWEEIGIHYNDCDKYLEYNR